MWRRAATFATVIIVIGAAAAQPPHSPERDFKFSEADRKLLEHSLQLDQQLRARGLVLRDLALERYLSDLAVPLISATPAPEHVVWAFHILGDASVNAFALPNGSTYVTTGLLAVLENEGQLSAVLAHEIAHVLQRDAYFQNRAYRRKIAVLNLALAIPIDVLEFPVPGVYLKVLAGVSQQLAAIAVRGYAAHVEHKADLIAVNRVLNAGWDPTQVSRALRLLGGSREPQWVRTLYDERAPLERRAASIESVVSGPNTASKTGTSGTYLLALEKAIRYNIQAAIDAALYQTAFTSAQRLATWRPNENEYKYLLAEAYRYLGPRSPPGTSRPGSSARIGAFDSRTLGRTPEEEERELLRSPSGAVTAQANQRAAAELYSEILQRDAQYAKAHRGLGFLLQQQGNAAAAVDQYRKYLALEPAAVDRLRIERRIQQLEATK